jgi:cellobiose phosphorylase
MNPLKQTLSLQSLSLPSGKVSFHLLPSGDVHRIDTQLRTDLTYQVNLLKGNLIDGQVANLYLRKKTDSGYVFEKLLGIHSPSSWTIVQHQAIYQGQALGVTYQVTLTVHERGWTYDVLLQPNGTLDTYDLTYGQDVGIAHPGGITANESYTCQYIDHQVFKQDASIAVLSRQNQGDPMYLQVGSTGPIQSYCTDGFQFFGLSFKENFIPEAMLKPDLANENLQYEFAYLTFRTPAFQLQKQAFHTRFYGLVETQPTVFLKSALPVSFLDRSLPWQAGLTLRKMAFKINPKHVLSGRDVSLKDIELRYPERVQEEWLSEQLVSFFTPAKRHVVLKNKEIVTQRPHAHILLGGDIEHAGDHVLASTNYMFGLFQSHFTLGNANFHKLLGDLRNALNVQTISGQRLYVFIKDRYYLLGLPSIYELGFNYAKWIYELGEDTIEVLVDIDLKGQATQLHFHSLQGIQYDVIATHQLIMNEAEYRQDIHVRMQDQSLVIDASTNGFITDHYPHLKYRIASSTPFMVGDESQFILTEEPMQGLLTLSFKQCSQFAITIEGTFKKTFPKLTTLPFQERVQQYDAFILDFASFNIHHPNHTIQQELKKLELITPWYTHNALVHYASPHGLEQFNGAAWGTRDVCQGPIELFMASLRYDLVREILVKVFSRAFVDRGDFPQWFMFDAYYRIQAHESHGDVIHWPLRALAYYLKETNDRTILDEKVTYFDKKKNQFTVKTYTIRHHVQTALKTISEEVIPGTTLPQYGGGDWDDTLQPANRELTQKMVSGWTVALYYEMLSVLASVRPFETKAANEELKNLSMKVKKDYQSYLMPEGIPAGFAIFESIKKRTYLLHPLDENTGLKYRLLPFNRGFISQLFSPDKIAAYLTIIRQHLKHPDGVRLMDTAVTYRGGQKTYFTRAETAANFGREIGIQYVHAHIRYIEAMAKIGQPMEAYWGMFAINPINLRDMVPHALPRQSNVYFSSSDADFLNRYQAKDNFEAVRLGKIAVKAGWRLYSSGPGIYIHQWISHLLGIRHEQGQLFLDPVLPHQLDQLSVEFFGKRFPTRIEFSYKKLQALPTINENIYRSRAKVELSSKKLVKISF